MPRPTAAPTPAPRTGRRARPVRSGRVASATAARSTVAAVGALVAVVAVGALATLVVTAPPGYAADPAEPDSGATTVTTRPIDRRIVEAGREVSAAEADRVGLVGAVADLDAAVADLDRRISGIDADLVPARAARDEVSTRLQGRAVTVYRRRSTGLGAALSMEGPGELAAGAHYADALAVVDGANLDRLQRVVDDLEARRAAATDERRDRVDERDRRADDLVRAQTRAALAAARVAALGGTPVMGVGPVSAATLAAWFRASGHTAVLAGGTTVEDLAAAFVTEGGAEGVRADLAFAQAIVETGWFAHALDNNYSGIGACDSCAGREIAFPSPQAGVRAQVQLLRNYADPDARAARLRHAPEATLYGDDPGAAARTYDGFGPKGTAPVWDAMGGGRWATDPDYAAKVLAVAAQIRAFRSPTG